MSIFSRSGVPLAGFIRGIVKALCDAQQAIPHTRDEVLHCHMDTDENGVMHPHTVPVEVSPGNVMNVPTYALSQVNTIGITRAHIRCHARIADLTECDECGTLSCGNSHIKFKVNPAYEGRKSFELELTFEARDPVETEALLVEALNEEIRPGD